MTRRTLFFGLLSAPVAALLGMAAAEAEPKQKRLLVVGPGRYTIAPSGGIFITGASSLRIEGCTFENCVIE